MANDDSVLPVRPDLTQNAGELSAIAERIKERDKQLKACKQMHWLQTGNDLTAAKALMPHGEFEKWCKEALNYGKRTAEKLMRAAETFGPMLKNEPGALLPPPTLIYALSAPSVPQAIRDAYAPRVIAGEAVGAEIRAAIKQHRNETKAADSSDTRRAAQTPEAQAAQVKREAALVQREGREQEKRPEREQQSAAQNEAIALILAQFGDRLSKLLALAAEAGSGAVLAPDIERALREQVPERKLSAVASTTDAATLSESAPGDKLDMINDAGGVVPETTKPAPDEVELETVCAETAPNLSTNCSATSSPAANTDRATAKVIYTRPTVRNNVINKAIHRTLSDSTVTSRPTRR